MHLPLYKLPALAAVEQVPGEECPDDCTKCALGTVRAPIPADGDPDKQGGILVVGDAPTKDEFASGRPFTGEAGIMVRRELERLIPGGNFVFTYALRCQVPRGVKSDKALPFIKSCQPHLKQLIDVVKPSRVLALGVLAQKALLGRSHQASAVHTANGWLWHNNVPVYFFGNPLFAKLNSAVGKEFRADLAAAVLGPLPLLPPYEGKVHIVRNAKDAQEAVGAMAAARWLSLDCETFGPLYTDNFRMLCLAVCAQGSDDAYVFTHEALLDVDCVALLQGMFDTHRYVYQNGKFDRQALRRLKLDPGFLQLDTRLVRKLLEPDALVKLAIQAELVGMGGHKEENAKYIKIAKGQITLWAKGDEPISDYMLAAERSRLRAKRKAERLAAKAIGAPIPSYKDLPEPETHYIAKDNWFDARVRKAILAGAKSDAYAYALVPSHVLHRYCGLDAITTARLADLLENRLVENAELSNVWNVALQPAAEAIEVIEQNGMLANLESMNALSAHLSLQISALEVRLRQYGADFNPGSQPQVAELLFKKLRLPVVSLTDTGLEATDKPTLLALKGKHPIVDDLLEWRRLSKLKGTYADGLPRFIQSDGRIHTSFNIDGARSGRISSQEPNLLNAPRANSEDGKLLRDCFAAPPGWLLVEGDYAQAELRVAALLSGDDAMKDIFRKGEDMHMSIAKGASQIIWRIKPEEVTDAHRSIIKTIVFGILYGRSDNALMQVTGCSKLEAETIRRAVLGRFLRLAEWIQEQIRRAYREGGCWTWWNGNPKFRWRPLPDLFDPDSERVSHAKRVSYNSPVQGTANEFCMASLPVLVDWIAATKFPARVVNTIYDAIICECAKGYERELVMKMRQVMCGWNSLDVPLDVDFKLGESWGSLVKFDERKEEAA